MQLVRKNTYKAPKGKNQAIIPGVKVNQIVSDQPKVEYQVGDFSTQEHNLEAENNPIVGNMKKSRNRRKEDLKTKIET